jgi:hypothetical protein
MQPAQLKIELQQIFTRNIKQYPDARELPVNFTGSIAWHFGEILHESAEENGFHTGTITQSPMEGLIQFHSVNEFTPKKPGS